MSLPNIYPSHPDDSTPKLVSLQINNIASERHVLLWWRNGSGAAQVVQLSGVRGNYAYIAPLAFSLSPSPSSSSSNSSTPTSPASPSSISSFSSSSSFTSSSTSSSSSTPIDLKAHQIPLGTLTRSQRDQLLQLAKEVRYEKGWMVNGPRVWMRDLLLAMVGVGLIPLAWFTSVDSVVPLAKRRPE